MQLALVCFKTFIQYGYFIISYNLQLKKNNKVYYCGKSLIDKPQGSHRLHEANYTDWFIILRFYYRLLFTVCQSGGKYAFVYESNGIGLYDDSSDEVYRCDFIERVCGLRPSVFIDKSKIINIQLSLFQKIIVAITFSIICILLLPASFSKRRALYALLLHEIFEHSVVEMLCKKYQIKHLFYSCIANKDSNASAYLLQKDGIYITKNPSEDPLYFHNQIIVADELGVCNPYQWAEIDEYKETIFVEKFSSWLPEQFKLLDIKHEPNIDNNEIGYYSSGNWLNKVLQHTDTSQGYDSYSAEAELEFYLKEYIHLNKQYQLRIYLHPLEKKESNMGFTIKHYQQIFGNASYSFADISKSTASMFSQSKVAVTVFSGIMTYRFYAGMKGILYNPYFKNFPIKGSIYDSISAKNKEQFFALLDESIQQSNYEFLKTKLNNKFQLNNHGNLT